MGNAATWWQSALKVAFFAKRSFQVLTLRQGSISSFSSHRTWGKEKVVCA